MEGDGKMGYKACSKSGNRTTGYVCVSNVINDMKSQLEMWRTPAYFSKKAHAQADCYDPSRMKDHMSSMFSLKEPDSSSRKMLGGTDGSRTDEGCLVELKDCD